MRIALLEDDPDQVDLISLWLEEAEHAVVAFDRGGDFLRAVKRDSFDMYLLDWMLPDVSGIEVLKTVRQAHDDRTPVLVATARQEERDIVTALEFGADDYLVKPVRRGELIARLAAIGRRYGQAGDGESFITVDPYVMDTTRNQAVCNGEVIVLTKREFDLAMFLFEHAGQAVSRAHILESIWDIDNDNVSTRTVDTHMSRLRKKMKFNEENGWKLSAIYQHGYRLERLGSDAAKATE